MPIVTQCTASGCETLTMGPLCVEHDQRTPKVFVRRLALTIRELTSEPVFTVDAPRPVARDVRRASERRVAARLRR
jgi:hypothetical protein